MVGQCPASKITHPLYRLYTIKGYTWGSGPNRQRPLLANSLIEFVIQIDTDRGLDEMFVKYTNP